MRYADRPRLLFAAGGTGGHVYPAVAIADEVRTMMPEAAIMFAGTRERLEWNAVPSAGYEIASIAAAGLQRSLTPKNLIMPFKAMKGFGQSVSLIKAFDPDVVIGTGGFVSAPVLSAAFATRRRTLIQEQNAYPGLANRFLGRWADEVHIAFPDAAKYFPSDRCFVSGNPTREELRDADRLDGRHFFNIPENAKVLFVFGGSLGSQALNEVLLATWQDIAGDEMVILWQTGPRYFERVREALGEGSGVRLLEYVNRMDLAYAAADLALCRSGAITCSELLVTGTPAVLVPSPNVTEDHQTKNAMSLVHAGAAVCVPEAELESTIAATIHELMANAERLSTMARSARDASHPQAARRVAKAAVRLADSYGQGEVGAQ